MEAGMMVHDIVRQQREQAMAAWQAAGGSIRRVRVLTSHSGYARFLAECGETLGTIPTLVDQPYRSSPTHAVMEWQGRKVFTAETKHKRYEVFEVLSGPVAPGGEDA
jgi:hypothetical protein